MMIDLRFGDWRDVLADLDVTGIDAVVTDPPYGINYKSGPLSRNSISSTGKRFTIGIDGDDRPFDPSPWLAFPAVAFTGAQYFYDRLPPGGSLHCWDKRGEYRPIDQADADVVWISHPMGCRVFHLVWRGLCRHAEHDKKIEHPTQKPIALMQWIIGLLDLPLGSTILDPYMGSGTTGIAALQLGMDFIGIEKHEPYFRIAERRIAKEAAQAKLFV